MCSRPVDCKSIHRWQSANSDLLNSPDRSAPRTHTFGLLLLVKHHQVQRVVEVLSHLGDIVTRQSVGAVDGLVLQVCPVDTILRGRRSRDGGNEETQVVSHFGNKHVMND